jgi:hypothetical protein
MLDKWRWLFGPSLYSGYLDLALDPVVINTEGWGKSERDCHLQDVL